MNLISEAAKAALFLLFGLLVGLSAPCPEAKTSDEKKWERIERNREIRIKTERTYEACVNKCRVGCVK